MATNRFGSAILAFLAVVALVAPEAAAQGRIYETIGDFQNGIIISLNDDDDRLLMPEEGTPMPFMWVPASERGSVLRVDVETGEVLGEFRTGPANLPRNPKRIAVDQLGNCWVMNQDYREHPDEGWPFCSELGYDFLGSISRIGVVIGGTRTDANGNPDPNGQYLKPPFRYNTCVDRDGDGLIRTSRGGGDVLTWLNENGEDDCGGVSTADDEAIINYQRINTETDAGVLVVDENNDLWVGGPQVVIGGLTPMLHQKFSGILGTPIPGELHFGDNCGGNTGAIGADGKLWTAPLESYWDTSVFDPKTGELVCSDSSIRAKAMVVDPTTGHRWLLGGDGEADRLEEYDLDNNLLQTIDLFALANDMAIDANGAIWVSVVPPEGAPSPGGVVRLIPDPANPGEYLFWSFFEIDRPTMVSIDSEGKIWVGSEVTDLLVRIDPDAGASPLAGMPPAGEIDGGALLPPNAGVEGVGDGSGFTVLATVVDQGQWIVTYDSEQEGTPWGTAYWDAIVPEGTNLIAEVRASDDLLAIPDLPYRRVEDGVAFNDQRGRYIEIRVTFERTDRALGESPILERFEIQASECHLLVAEGEGTDTFQTGSNAHVFQTKLGNIIRSYPVLMEDIPEISFQLPRPEALTAGASVVGVDGVKPVETFHVQVVMWNPRVFPENEEQSTPGLRVQIWSDGSITTKKYGEADGNMDLELEVVRREGRRITVRVPFVVGM